ncbi:RHS repeat-associated core domain-containing protein [Erwinia amylovora]|uniref:RHS repeat domain-containing protein n=1 Tax=Erwinia amylovora TaxID=552 RepID=UPI0020BF9887|nr:RHS repeat-associated core domain-containing protein [Erwinia amylovora]MCK8343366.1 RHS repeat-associated core domain-containing protein [Erwinia amylovora]
MEIINNGVDNVILSTQQDNFLSACMSGVDPRTGFFNHATTIFDYNSVNSDARFTFVLNYNSKSIYYNQGYGYGFTDNLSRYDAELKTLMLSSGQVYTIANDMDDDPSDLVSFDFENFTFTKNRVKDVTGEEPKISYYIKYIDGVIERMVNRDLSGGGQKIYVPSVIYYGVTSEIHLQWDYIDGVPFLQSVKEHKSGTYTSGYLLSFMAGNKNERTIRLFENEPYEYKVILYINEKNLLAEIKNFGLDSGGIYKWEFKYTNKIGKGRLLNEIRYPCGRNDKIEYIRARGRSNIPSSKILKLFVVRRYYISPQFVAGIKKIVTQYHFKKTDENERYLSAEEYMDISFRVMRRITRNYNKFHLLISELTEVGMTTTEIIYSYLNCDEKKELLHQAANYQCITETATTYTDLSIAKNNTRRDKVEMFYDEKGNLTRQINNNISIIFFSYALRVNQGGVLVDIPNGMRLLESLEIMYLKSQGNNIVKEYEYELISKPAVMIGNPEEPKTYKLVLVNESTHINNILIKSTSLKYFKSIHDRENLGKLKSTRIKCFDRIKVKEFTWSGGSYYDDLTLYTKTMINELIIEEVLVWNAITGLLNSATDSLGRKLEYQRDKVGRILNTIMTSNINDHARSRKFKHYYEYSIENISGTLFYQKKTVDLHHNSIYERYDGLGRLQYVAMRKKHSNEEKILHAYKYDYLSRIEFEEHFTHKGSKSFSLASIYSYDDWGYIKTLRHNDGVEENVVTDLINRTKSHWLAVGEKKINETKITFDINNQPVSYKRYLSDGQFLQTIFERDFCGRLIKHQDELGSITEYGYDLYDRVNKIVFPDNSVIDKKYSIYSEQQLVENITFTSADGKVHDIGVQTFDELERIIEKESYGVKTKYVYSLHQTLPDEIVFADGTSNFYENNYALNDNILSVTDDKGEFIKKFKYSDVDGLLKETKFFTPKDTYIENIEEDNLNNIVEIITKFIHDGKIIEMMYKQEDNYNNEGIYKITDETNTEFVYSRDLYGRITEIASGQEKTKIAYDIFSRISIIDEYDLEGKSVVQLSYDELSREIGRKVQIYFDNDPSLSQPSISFTVSSKYHKNNLLKSRSIEQYSGENKIDIRKESFNYDIMNRIIFYECIGIIPTVDKNNKAIKTIGYSYDTVGNIVITDTVYSDESRARVSFIYDEKNPFILSWMQNESTLDITQNEYNRLGFLVNKTYTKRINADFSKKQEVDYRYNNLLCLSSVTNKTTGTHLSDESQNIEYRFGTTGKLFFRKSVKDKVKNEQIITHRGYNEEITNFIDFEDQSKMTLINSAYGASKMILQKTDVLTTNYKMVTNNSNTPIFVAKYWGGRYVSSEYSTIGIYGSLGKNSMQLALNGCLFDDESGGYIMGGRIYDPESMRFTTPDSLSPFNGGNINPYIYCNNNPVNNSDNTGYLTRETWKNIIYIGAVLSVGTGILTLGCSIAMSSVLISVMSIIQITGGAFSLASLKNINDDSELAAHGISTLFDIGLSFFNVAKLSRLPLSKNLSSFFDFNRSLTNLRTLPVNKNRKKISGVNYLGRGVSIFNDTYKKKARLNIYSHGKRAALIETRMDDSGKLYEKFRLSSQSLDNLLRTSGGIKYDDYASIRIIACHSGDPSQYKSAIGFDMHKITGLPVKAFHGDVTIFGIPPETLQSYFERHSTDPHSLHNIRKKFSAEFELIHNSNYLPTYFS